MTAPRVNECDHPERKHQARGMCRACYQRQYRADPAVAERKREYDRQYRADTAVAERDRERRADPAVAERKREYDRQRRARLKARKDSVTCQPPPTPPSA